MDISILPLELQWLIGQYCNLCFPLDVKDIITRDNYNIYVTHAMNRDTVGHLRLILDVIKDFNIPKYLNRLSAACAIIGQLDCLKFLTREGYLKHQDATRYAAEKGHLTCLEFLTREGYPKHPHATLWAAKNGHLSCLKFLTQEGYNKDPDAVIAAKEYRHLQCYEYCLANGYSE